MLFASSNFPLAWGEHLHVFERERRRRAVSDGADEIGEEAQPYASATDAGREDLGHPDECRAVNGLEDDNVYKNHKDACGESGLVAGAEILPLQNSFDQKNDR